MSWTVGQELQASLNELSWWQENSRRDSARSITFYRRGLTARQEDVDRAMNAVVAARTEETPESREEA